MTTTSIRLPCTFRSDSFARYQPFGDGREVVVRRGKELGFHYGLETGRRTVVIDGVEVVVRRHLAVRSPPPLGPGRPPLAPGAAGRYRPESDVVVLPDAEVAIPRHPDGFSDDEVERILAAIALV